MDRTIRTEGPPRTMVMAVHALCAARRALDASSNAVRRALDAIPDDTQPALEQALMDYNDANRNAAYALDQEMQRRSMAPLVHLLGDATPEHDGGMDNDHCGPR